MSVNKPLILLVEDDKLLLETLKDLVDKKYNFDCAKDGEKALEFINDPQAKYDLLLLDIMLPKLNGFQVLSKIKTNRFPILILSAQADKMSYLKAYTLGAWGYSAKPFDNITLLSQMDNLIRLGKAMKELKKQNENEKEKKVFAQKMVLKMQEELKQLKSQKKDIAEYRLGKREVHENDSFDDILESLKSIANLLDTQFKEIHTLLSFYFPQPNDLGMEEQFRNMEEMIFELFELLDSLKYLKIY